MTVTTTYTTSGDLSVRDGIYEDLKSLITNISPEKTPFISSLNQTRAKSTLHEWLTDELKKPTGANAALEGADAVATTRTPPARLSNFTQIIEDTFQISGTLDAVSLIGRREENRYQMLNSVKYLATEAEYICINSASAVPGDGSTPRQTKGLEGFLTSNDKSFASYATGNDFDENKLISMLQACYVQGGEPTKLLVPPDQARKISNWNQENRITVQQNANEQALNMAVFKLIIPFGRVDVVIDLFVKQDVNASTNYDRVYVYDPGMFEVAWLRPMTTLELAKSGDSRKFQNIGEFAFVAKNEKSSAKCRKCATD
jgi:hypothetical protein